MPVNALDPQAIKALAWDWKNWLDAGETITAATIVASTGLTATTPVISGTKVLSKLSVTGSPTPTRGTATCHITTSAGQQDDRTWKFVVRDT